MCMTKELNKIQNNIPLFYVSFQIIKNELGIHKNYEFQVNTCKLRVNMINKGSNQVMLMQIRNHKE